MEPIIKVDNVSMCFNLSKEKHESLKEYFLAMVQGRLQYDEFYALKDVSLESRQCRQTPHIEYRQSESEAFQRWHCRSSAVFLH